MQIPALSNPSLRGALPDTALATSSQQSRPTPPSVDKEGKRPTDGSQSSEPTPDIAESTLVTLSATPAAVEKAAELSPVYAEIWKNGNKVAVVDTAGGVRSGSGIVAASQGAEGGGGELLAARRAAEIAGSIGGEIRIAGQQIDSRTLAMRVKLNATYGAVFNRT